METNRTGIVLNPGRWLAAAVTAIALATLAGGLACGSDSDPVDELIKEEAERSYQEIVKFDYPFQLSSRFDATDDRIASACETLRDNNWDARSATAVMLTVIRAMPINAQIGFELIAVMEAIYLQVDNIEQYCEQKL